MKFLRIILLLVFLVIYVVSANAQTTLITGVVGEKTNVELAIYRTANKKTEMAAEYKVFAASPEFAFAIPVEKGTNYSLTVCVMKQGHRRLEVDKRYKFPLSLNGGQNLSMKITPSLLDTARKKGVEIKSTTNLPAISFVSGNLVNSSMGAGVISLQKVEAGKLITITGSNTTRTNKRFQLAIPVKKEGFYYVSSLRFRCRVYLKPADELELNLNAISGGYDVINGSDENRLMEKWQKLSLPVTGYGYNLSVFQNDSLDLSKYLLAYQKLQPAIADFKATNKLSNECFNHLFDVAIDVDNEYAPLYLWFRLSSKRNIKSGSSYASIYELPLFDPQLFQPGKFNDAKILEVGEGMAYINLYQKLSFLFIDVSTATRLWREDKMKIMMNSIINDTVKAYFLKDQLETNEVKISVSLEQSISHTRNIHFPRR